MQPLYDLDLYQGLKEQLATFLISSNSRDKNLLHFTSQVAVRQETKQFPKTMELKVCREVGVKDGHYATHHGCKNGRQKQEVQMEITAFTSNMRHVPRVTNH